MGLSKDQVERVIQEVKDEADREYRGYNPWLREKSHEDGIEYQGVFNREHQKHSLQIIGDAIDAGDFKNLR